MFYINRATGEVWCTPAEHSHVLPPLPWNGLPLQGPLKSLPLAMGARSSECSGPFPSRGRNVDVLLDLVLYCRVVQGTALVVHV